MRKSLLKGLALLLISISPFVSGVPGCSKPNLDASNSPKVEYRESEKNHQTPEEDYEKLKRENDLLSKQNDEYSRALSKYKKENFRWNIEEAIGLGRLAKNNVVIEKLNTKVSESELKILKYENALRKLWLSPDEVEKHGIDDKESPFQLKEAKMERDRIAWERDSAYYETEISRLKKRIYELERTQYSIPASKN